MIAYVGDTANSGENLLLRDPSLRLDHIGIAVQSIAAAKSSYQALGLSVSAEELVEHERVKVAMLILGTSRLELIEPLSEDSTVGRFLQRRGEGLHHIALYTEDIERKFTDLQRDGIRLVGDSIGSGAGGHRYFFVHPASCGGVLVEIVGGGIDPEKAAR